MLPPKNSLATGDDADVVAVRGRRRAARARAAPNCAGEDADRCVAPRRRADAAARRSCAVPLTASQARVAGRVAGRPVPSAGAPSTQAKKPALRPGRRATGTVELVLERARHADAVLVHLEALVRRRRRERSAAEEVVLVGGEHHPPAEHVEEHVLPVLEPRRRPRPRLVACVQAHRRLGVEPRHPERHDRDASQLGVPVEHAGERVVERRAVVDAGTHDDLAAHLMPWSSSARSQRRLVAPRRLRSIRARSAGSVAWMLTFNGESRSVTTRSRSASVKRVRVVKFP